MILCPNCQHHEISGALFCSECGAQLVFTENMGTQTIKQDVIDSTAIHAPAPPARSTAPINPATIPEAPPESPVTLHLIDSGRMLPITGRNEFTLGRATEGQPILPDVDLAPYDAFAQGVSRLHAALKIVNMKLVVVDLGSSNGTRVNGQKIVPNVDYPLNHGDIIALGKLKVQVLIHL